MTTKRPGGTNSGTGKKSVPAHAAQPVRYAPSPRASRRSREQNERDYLVDILCQAEGKLYGRDGAAAIAQLKPTPLRNQLVKHGLR
jgi:hypothetical protein